MLAEHPWKDYPACEETDIRVSAGPLELIFGRRGHDWLMAEIREDAAPQADSAEHSPWDSGFQRFAFEEDVETIFLRPRMPNRPVVVRPLHPLTIAPGAKVEFYISLPVDAQVYARLRSGRQMTIARLPTERLSDTWFGNTVEGTFAYSLKSRARRELHEISEIAPNRVICPLRISNASADPLPCDKFCLRLQHCRIWSEPSGRMRASAITLRFHGGEQMTTADYESAAPDKATLLMEADQPATRNLLQRSFGLHG